jgi:DNA repair exonuclease SbcCD ATPase subunit
MTRERSNEEIREAVEPAKDWRSEAESRLVDRRCRCGRPAARLQRECWWHPSVSAEYAHDLADALAAVRVERDALAVENERLNEVLDDIRGPLGRETMAAVLERAEEAEARAAALQTEVERLQAVIRVSDETMEKAGNEWEAENLALTAKLAALQTAIEAAEAAGRNVAAISAMISGSYPATLDAEAHMWRRHQKVPNEAAEVLDAIEGAIGENPRKGITKTWTDVDKELLDTANAALGAYEYNHGNDGSSVGALFAHIEFVRDRLAAAVGAVPETRDETEKQR